MQNPFITGDTVPPQQFIGRENEIRRLAEQIKKGSSTIVVGDPRVGKTSLLKYLEEGGEYLYGSKFASKLWFEFLNAQTFAPSFDAPQFWQRVTTPLYEKVFKNSDSPMVSAYEKCKKDNFSSYSLLEVFFKKLHDGGWCLIILVDEFDDVISERSKLYSNSFLGNLRTMASTLPSLAYVVAARQSLIQINAKTRKFTDGSPYFNTPNSITLGLFPEKDCAELLGWAGEHFTTIDRRYLVELTGRYPYLLQVAASELWESYIEIPDNVSKRYRQVERKLHDVVACMYNDMWRLWSHEMRIAFIGAALPDLRLSNPKFKTHNLISDLKSMNEELIELQKRGLIIEDNQSDSKWRVCSLVSLWWLADQISHEIHDEASCKEWLQKQQIERFLITREQKKKWSEALRSVSEVFKDGAKTLTESIAKGFAETLTK